MADIAATLRAWSVTAASNSPSGATIIGTGLDDNLRQLQATVRQFLASKGSNMSSASTVDLSTADGFFIDVTGTVTITSLGTEVVGIPYCLRFTGALTFTHNGTSLILPGGVNITTANGDIAEVISLGSGNWQCTNYMRASGLPIVAPTVSFPTQDNYICDGRLTLSSGVAVTTSDVTAATTIYFTPYHGNRIATYSGSAWSVNTFTEKSVSVPATTTTPFDVFIVDSTLALETVNWTNDTTRATAIALQDGVYVKSGTTTRRYLGTCRTTGVSGQTEDSEAQRLVWNYYNRVERAVRKTFSTARSTSSTSYAEINSEIRAPFVIGVLEDNHRFIITGSAFATNTNDNIGTALGIDGTTALESTNANYSGANGTVNISIYASRNVAVGYHYATLLGCVLNSTGTWQAGAASNTNSAAQIQVLVRG